MSERGRHIKLMPLDPCLQVMTRSGGNINDLRTAIVEQMGEVTRCPTNAVEPGHGSVARARERYIKTRTLNFVTFTVDSDPPTPAPTLIL